jgi:hypothetical protein
MMDSRSPAEKLRDIAKGTKTFPMDDILLKLSVLTGCGVSEVNRNGRETQHAIDVRFVFYWALYTYCEISMNTIAKILQRDRSSVSHGIARVNAWEHTDPIRWRWLQDAKSILEGDK